MKCEDKIRESLVGISPAPWNACRDGECPCNNVGYADGPVADVYRGEWGDKFASIRPIPGTGSIEGKFEAFIETAVWGHVDEDEAKANARFIALARSAIPFLLSELDKERRAHKKTKRINARRRI